MTRISISVFDSRKPLVDVKRQRELLELPSKRLSEIFRESKHRRKPTVIRAGYKINLIRIRRVCEVIRKYEWYRAGLIAVFRLLQKYVGDGRLFLLSGKKCRNKFTV